MASRDTVKKILAIIAEAYNGRFQLSKPIDGICPTESIWFGALKDLDDTRLSRAVLDWICVEKWPPTIADLRDKSTSTTQYPSPASAWKRVLDYLRDQSGINEITDLERKALKCTGTSWDILHSANPASDRARFISAYEKNLAEDREKRITPSKMRLEK